MRINAQSLSSGFSTLISFREFPLVTFIMLVIAICVISFMIGNFKKIMLSGSEYKLINPNKVLSRKEKEIYGLLEDLIRDSKTIADEVEYDIKDHELNIIDINNLSENAGLINTVNIS